MTFFMSIRQKWEKSGKGRGEGWRICRDREENGNRAGKTPTDLADLSEGKMQDSMQLYKAYYPDMHACRSGKTPPRRQKILLTKGESYDILLSDMEFWFHKFAGVAQLVEQLIRNQ